MSDTITIQAIPFKSFIFDAFQEEYTQFSKRYFNLSEEVSLEIFHVVVHQFYLKINAGETELTQKPLRNLQSIGIQEVLKYFRNNPPGLNGV